MDSPALTSCGYGVNMREENVLKFVSSALLDDRLQDVWENESPALVSEEEQRAQFNKWLMGGGQQ